MREHRPGLVVLMTDCCSDRFKLPGKTRRIYTDVGTASTIQPVLGCLLFRSRGVVDITASSGNAAFGDDHDGGIFTRTFDRLVREKSANVDTDHDGFVSWQEFFARVQNETEGTFVTSAGASGLWARRSNSNRKGRRRLPWPRAVARGPSGYGMRPSSRWNTSIAGPAARLGKRPSRTRSKAGRSTTRTWRPDGTNTGGPFQRQQDVAIAAGQDVSLPRFQESTRFPTSPEATRRDSSSPAGG